MKKNGFTILELLIATTVFSVILLLTMVGVSRMGSLFYKGLVMTQMQETSRSITDEIISQIQFGSGDIQSSTGTNITLGTGGVEVIFCVGDYRYKINPNVPSADSFMRENRTSNGCDPSTATDPFDIGATNLLPAKTRVSRFVLSQNAGGLWTIDIGLAFGDNEDLVFGSADGSFSNVYAEYSTAYCRSGETGAEFCATSGLKTSVYRRIE